MRSAHCLRETQETQICVDLNLDDLNETVIETPIGFFNHMLELFSFHSGIGLKVLASGDTEVDDHHLVEDTGIVLGTALNSALGLRQGIRRYGSCRLPMDESLAQVDLDFSGRPYLVFDARFHRDAIGSFSTEMVEEFLRAFSEASKLTLHVHLTGRNDHHQIEALFKGLGRAVKEAVRIESDRMPSTKGTLS